MSPDPSLLDTNVLVYAVFQSSLQHTASRAVLDLAKNAGANLHVAPQNLAEFYSIVMSPRRVTQPKSALEALNAINSMVNLPGLSVLPVPADVVSRWTQLVGQHGVLGQKVFDVQLVATMMANGVNKIYSFNTGDFQVFPGIQAVVP